MTKPKLQQLITKGESQTVEFKPSLSQGKRLIEIIASFANSFGGHFLIGIRDDATLCGVKLGSKTLANLAVIIHPAFPYRPIITLNEIYEVAINQRGFGARCLHRVPDGVSRLTGTQLTGNGDSYDW